MAVEEEQTLRCQTRNKLPGSNDIEMFLQCLYLYFGHKNLPLLVLINTLKIQTPLLAKLKYFPICEVLPINFSLPLLD